MCRCNDVDGRKSPERENRRAAAGVLYSARVLVCAAAFLLVPGGALKAFCNHLELGPGRPCTLTLRNAQAFSMSGMALL